MSFFKKNNEEYQENNDNSWNMSDMSTLIKDEKIPIIRDQTGKIIFERDIKNKRVIMSNYILNKLAKDGQLKDCIDYFKSEDTIDCIALYEYRSKGTIFINAYIKGNDTYFVPFTYNDESEKNSDDNKIYYSKTALEIDEKKGIDISEAENIEMDRATFSSAKDKNNQNKYLPLFLSEEELRSIFNSGEYKIAKISYTEAVLYANKYLGIVFRPDKESFIIPNNSARFLGAVAKYYKPSIDYRKFTQNQITIQDKIKKLYALKTKNPKFKDYYNGILQNIADLDKIYIALNRNEFNNKTGTSIPLIGNKYGNNTIYIFSEFEIAKKWTQQYCNITKDGIPLIGVVNREDNFNSLFSIADKMGIKICTIDDEESFLIFNLKLFKELNDFGSTIKIKIPKQVADKNMLSDKKRKINLQFNRIGVVGMDNLSNSIEYSEFQIQL